MRKKVYLTLVRKVLALLFVVFLFVGNGVRSQAFEDERLIGVDPDSNEGVYEYETRFAENFQTKFKFSDGMNQYLREEKKTVNGHNLSGATYLRCPTLYFKTKCSTDGFNDSSFDHSYIQDWNYRAYVTDKKKKNKYCISRWNVNEKKIPKEDPFLSNVFFPYNIYEWAGYDYFFTDTIYNHNGEEKSQNKVLYKKGSTVYFCIDLLCKFRAHTESGWKSYRAIDGEHYIKYTIPSNLKKPEMYALKNKKNVYLCYYIEGENCITQYRYKGNGKWKTIPKATGKSKPIIKCKLAANNLKDFKIRCRSWEKINGKKIYSKWSKSVNISSSIKEGWYN